MQEARKKKVTDYQSTPKSQKEDLSLSIYPTAPAAQEEEKIDELQVDSVKSEGGMGSLDADIDAHDIAEA